MKPQIQIAGTFAALVLTSCFSFKLPQGSSLQASPTPEPTTGVAALARANSELMSEMMKVVFKDPKAGDPSEFGAWVHSLNQGASLEGIYRGLIMGSRYRAMESTGQAAAPQVLKLFVTELVELQLSMSQPTVFESEESSLPPSIDYPGESKVLSRPRAGVPKIQAAHHDQEVRPKKDRVQLSNELLSIFIGATPYTLKRVLAEEGLRKLDELASSPGELGQWYAAWVIRLSSTPVDFGLEQRKKPDFDFHFNFSQKMSLDRVKWEVLNRLHRLLNDAIEKN